MRVLIQAGYAIRRRLRGWLRIRTRGVKVMLFNNAGELLVVRNSYGNRAQFILPGGGVARTEDPEEAARRELREELSVVARNLTLIGTYRSSAEGKRDIIHLFKGTVDGVPSPDGTEIEEARFISLEALPEDVSPATRRRLAEMRGERPIDGRW